MDTKQIAEKLVDFCRRGKNLEAVNTLYDKDIVSIEAQGSPEMPAEQRGIEAIRRKHQWWNENMDVHKSEVSGPFATMSSLRRMDRARASARKCRKSASTV